MLSIIEHFAYFLVGKDFKVFTDHKALVRVFHSSTLNNRLWRWHVRLVDFTFDMVYIQGHLNVLADAIIAAGLARPTTVLEPLQSLEEVSPS